MLEAHKHIHTCKIEKKIKIIKNTQSKHNIAILCLLRINYSLLGILKQYKIKYENLDRRIRALSHECRVNRYQTNFF